MVVSACRQKGAEAAERARIMAEYLQRRKEAAQNKARGQADLYGVGFYCLE